MIIEARELARITGGSLTGDDSLRVTGIMTDSRVPGAGPEMLFIALRGPNHDGNKFIELLYGRGVRLFLADTLPPGHREMNGAGFVTVEDTLEALHRLAKWRRESFRGKVIAVTGSTGKTIVKEWLAGTMSLAKSVIRSPKSYNSQVGVALSLMNLDDHYEMAVIEAGISRPGEMERLARIIRPDTVIITNIGDAHGEHFPGRTAIATEKLKLTAGADIVICCADDEIIMNEMAASHPGIPLFTWTLSGRNAALAVEASDTGNNGRILRCTTVEGSFDAVIPFADQASTENAVSVIACCLAGKIPAETIARGMAELPAVAMRMEVKRGRNGCTLIEDYYNSDPASLGMALDFLRTHARGKTTLILSDFRQIGGDEKLLYEGVARANSLAKLTEPLIVLENKEDFMQKLQDIMQEHDISLVIIGLPRSLEGNETEQSAYTRRFVSDNFQDIPVKFQDETLSSVEAEKRLKSFGLDNRPDMLDAVAACIILEDYFNYESH